VSSRHLQDGEAALIVQAGRRGQGEAIGGNEGQSFGILWRWSTKEGGGEVGMMDCAVRPFRRLHRSEGLCEVCIPLHILDSLISRTH
jgi:hypothetical protein